MKPIDTRDDSCKQDISDAFQTHVADIGGIFPISKAADARRHFAAGYCASQTQSPWVPVTQKSESEYISECQVGDFANLYGYDCTEKKPFLTWGLWEEPSEKLGHNGRFYSFYANTHFVVTHIQIPQPPKTGGEG